MQTVELCIRNASGLHARPASVFSKTAAAYQSRVTMIADGVKYNAKSVLKVLSAEINAGQTITLQAEGPDEMEAIAALKQAVEEGLGEPV